MSIAKLRALTETTQAIPTGSARPSSQSRGFCACSALALRRRELNVVNVHRAVPLGIGDSLGAIDVQVSAVDTMLLIARRVMDAIR